MQQEVDRAPTLCGLTEDGVDGRGFAHVAMAEHEAADLGGQRLDPLLERVALIGEGQLGAMRMARLGNAPRDGPAVGDPHDQAALPAHQTRGFRHSPPAALPVARPAAPMA